MLPFLFVLYLRVTPLLLEGVSQLTFYVSKIWKYCIDMYVARTQMLGQSIPLPGLCLLQVFPKSHSENSEW